MALSAPKSPLKFSALYLPLILLGFLTVQGLWTTYTTTSPIPYSQFQQLLKSGQIEEVMILQDHLHGTLKTPLENGRNQFITARVEKDLSEAFDKAGVKYSRAVENTWIRDILSWVVPGLVMFGLWIFIMRRFSKGGVGGQLMSIGKSKARVYVENDTKVRFDDVAGIDEAKGELQEIVEFLKDQAKYGRLGARMPKGVLLVGPPGTGKTLIAKAIAGEAQVPFFSISGSEFVEMFVGVGAARVRDLFEQARQKAPCIIFIDELDALGRARSSVAGGGHDEKEQTLNQLLVELDGFDSSSGLVLIGATNRPEVLDPALLRAGRFDRQVLIDRPDKLGRHAILTVHGKKLKLAADVSLEQIAALTPGFTGADLANLANEAAIVATRAGAEHVATEHFTQAIERIVAGLEKKNRLLNETERNIVAYHEMGHAIVAEVISTTDRVHKVSIIPRGIGALGYTLPRPTEERYLMRQGELAAKMAVLMGGRAAEELVFGDVSTGASDDISKATQIAREMVTRYGMDGDLGHVAYEREPHSFLGTRVGGERLYSDRSAEKIDAAVKSRISEALSTALAILKRNRAVLEESARQLLQSETFTEGELRPFFEKLDRAPT